MARVGLPVASPFFCPCGYSAACSGTKFPSHLGKAYRQGKLKFLGDLASLAEPKAFGALCEKAARIDWVVYAKRPFGGPEQVLKYLARYTHRVAISNSRLLSLENGRVTFEWKDYAHNSQVKPMALDAAEFMRRFLLHVLPMVLCAFGNSASWRIGYVSGNWHCAVLCWAPSSRTSPLVPALQPTVIAKPNSRLASARHARPAG
jgi:hypothetical protein